MSNEMEGLGAVLASMKVRNLKANHNIVLWVDSDLKAVLASMKVRNLKANHNKLAVKSSQVLLY